MAKRRRKKPTTFREYLINLLNMFPEIELRIRYTYNDTLEKIRFLRRNGHAYYKWINDKRYRTSCFTKNIPHNSTDTNLVNAMFKYDNQYRAEILYYKVYIREQLVRTININKG